MMSQSRFRHCATVALCAATVLAGCASAGTGTLTPARIAAADSAMRAAIANEGALATASAPSNAIAVTPLAAPAGDTLLTALAYGLAELVATDLAEARAVTVVDRLQLDALLRELRLAQSGRVDSATAPRVGRLIGAGRVIVGAITPVTSGDVAVTARIADVGSGAVAGGIDARSAVDRIFEAEKALVFRLLDELGVVPTPRERERIANRRTDDLRALLAFSKGVEARVLGDIELARSGFREAARLAPSFAPARAAQRELDAPVVSDLGDPLARVTQATATAVNPPVPVRVVEAADAPIQTLRQVVELLITLRVP